MASPGGNGGVGVGSLTYVQAQAKVGTVVGTLTNTEQIAMYLQDDLLKLITDAGIDLFGALNVPDDYGKDQADLVAMICADIEQMLRRRLISGAEILLSDPDPDANGRYVLRYQASYKVEDKQATINPNAAEKLGPLGGTIKTLRQTFPGARFAFGVTFRGGVALNDIRRPFYLFDWLPNGGTFDGRHLVTFRFGGYNTSDTRVTRVEFADAQNVGTP
ncbi:MAG TPA: hypothetical protein VMV29_00175 [Ktedonobacterales bacterium]|nr:hypothetical protein [Ktedonobacterales bacterium]